MHAMSPPLRGLNPPNPTVPRPTNAAKLRPTKELAADLPDDVMSHASSPLTEPSARGRQVQLPQASCLACASETGLKWAGLITAPLVEAPSKRVVGANRRIPAWMHFSARTGRRRTGIGQSLTNRGSRNRQTPITGRHSHWNATAFV